MASEESPANCRFYVMIDGITEALFTEVSGLQVETTLMDYEEGGTNGFVHRLPTRTKVGNLTLKRGMMKSNALFAWYLKTVQGKTDRRNMTIVMYDPAGHEVMRWSFDQAFPVKWVGPQFSAEGKAIAVETLELAHAGLRIE